MLGNVKSQDFQRCCLVFCPQSVGEAMEVGFFLLSDHFLSRQKERTICVLWKLLRHSNMSSEYMHTAGGDKKREYDTGS